MQLRLQYAILEQLSEEDMRLDNDFDENIKELSKYAIILCSVAIVIWFVMSIVKLIKPEEVIPKKNIAKENPKIEDTLSKLVDESADNDEIQFEKEEAKIQRAGNKNFVLYVSELPDNVYFTRIYTPEKILNERRALINNKVGENYIDSVFEVQRRIIFVFYTEI